MFDWIAKKPFEWIEIGHESKKKGELITFINYFDDSKYLLVLTYNKRCFALGQDKKILLK